MEPIDSIVETCVNNIKIVRFNKPSRKNAIDAAMYRKVKNILNKAAKDDKVSVLVLTGTGDFYSSGNDFKATLDENNLVILKEYIDAFITFPKLLVAIVNGPAIGIAATTLAMCDLVFAEEHSYFYTPFSKLGLVAEGCSTFTFPRLIGERKATEMLMYDYKMSAEEALKCGFVNYVYKPQEYEQKVWSKIVEISALSPMSLCMTKKILKGSLHEQLLKTNAVEIAALRDISMATKEKSKL